MQKSLKQKTVILDSSVWIALMIENDINHQKAKTMFSQIKSTKMNIIMPDIIFYEVVTVLVKFRNTQFLYIFLNLNLKLSYIPPKQFLFHLFRYESILIAKTSDFLILIYCMYYNVNQFETFDQKQKLNYTLIQEYEKGY